MEFIVGIITVWLTVHTIVLAFLAIGCAKDGIDLGADLTHSRFTRWVAGKGEQLRKGTK